jgi:hypothetical protein
MNRTSCLATTSVAALSLSGAAASACSLTALTLTCTGADPGSSDAMPDLTIIVKESAPVSAVGRAMELAGARQTVQNDGTIQSTNNEAIRSGGANVRTENDGNKDGVADDGVQFAAVTVESRGVIQRSDDGRRGSTRPPPRARQNRKYRCAIGSTEAGSQVRSSPSARTS